MVTSGGSTAKHQSVKYKMRILTQDIELDVELVCHQTARLLFCRLATQGTCKKEKKIKKKIINWNGNCNKIEIARLSIRSLPLARQSVTMVSFSSTEASVL